MSVFLMLHGAASTGWLWHLVRPLLEQRGHRVATPDLPCEDPAAGLLAYADVACAAVADITDEPVVVVAQSMAGLFAPLVAQRRPTSGIALLAAMIPQSGETGAQWWTATHQAQAQRHYLVGLGLVDAADIDTFDGFDPETVFVHDLPEALRAASADQVRNQQSLIMTEPSPVTRWPGVPTLVVAAEGDRLFPLQLMRAQARTRLGLEPVMVPGGHLAALSHPQEVADTLHAFAATLPTI